MASKELLDRYQIDLGHYYKATMAKFFREFPDGEVGFLESLMIFPIDGDSCDIDDARNALRTFDDEYGSIYELFLDAVGFDSNIKPVYHLSFDLIFQGINYGDDSAQFSVGEQSPQVPQLTV